MTTIVELTDVLRAFDSSTMGPDNVTLQSELDWLNLSLAYLVTPEFGSFPVTNWEDGAPLKALLQNNAHTMGTMSPTVFNAICGGLLDLATGDWLDFWAASTYNGEKRTPAVQQVQTLWFAITSALNLSANDLVVGASTGSPSYSPVIEDPNNPGSYVQSGISVPTPGQNGTYQPSGLPLTFDVASGTYPIKVQALETSAGSAGQSTPGEINTIIQPTGLPVQFVSDVNPTTGVPAILQKGQDAEPDILFQARLRSMWPALSKMVAGVRRGWIAMTKAGDAKVNRVAVRECYPQAGAVTLAIDPAAEVAKVFTWFNGAQAVQATNYFPPLNNTDNVGHRPFNSNVYVQAATYTNITLTGSVVCAKAQIDAARNTLAAYLAKYQSSVLFGPLIYYSLILATIQRLTGVDHIDGFQMNGAVDDVQVPLDGLPDFQDNLTWVSV